MEEEQLPPAALLQGSTTLAIPSIIENLRR